MKGKRFENWLEKIYNTQDEEINCSECFDLVSHYVEQELLGANPADKMPQVKQHLSQCPACHEEYETLRDLRRLEEEGGTESLDDLTSLLH